MATALLGALVATPVSAAPEPGTPLVVNATGTAPDINIGDGVCDTGFTVETGEARCSLRAAIQETNQSGADHIHFNIPTTDPGYDGVRWRISVNGSLPTIVGDTEIEANTQPGFNGTPVIELHNSGSAPTGIRFADANGGSLEHLSITGFTGFGIELANSQNIRIAGNYVGVTPSGTSDGNGADGIHINNGSDNNVIANNVVGASGQDGIHVEDAPNTSIDGNRIGTLLGADLGNEENGINVLGGTTNTTIGATTGNIIGFNDSAGIHVRGARDIQIFNNEVGYDVSRNQPIPNDSGVWVALGTNITVGSTGQPNTVSANTRPGVVAGGGSTTVEGNFIGTDSTGRTGIGNGNQGVFIAPSADAVIRGNAIHNNNSDGILSIATASVISQNSILGNGDQPIDLANDGFTPNDPGDTDTGAHDFLNFPEIVDITNTTTGASITVNLDVPAGDYTIELFEYEPLSTTGFNNTNHFVRSFPFTSNGTATTQILTGFNATTGHTLTLTTTELSRGITSETSPTTIVPTQTTTPTTTTIPEPATNEPAPVTTTTPPDTTTNAPTTQGTTAPTTRPAGPAAQTPAQPGPQNLGTGAIPGPGSALPFQENQDPTTPTTLPLLNDPSEEGETEPAEAPPGGPTDDSGDETNSGEPAPVRAADIQSSSLTVEAEEIIDETEPELATVEGITFRTGRVVNELVDVRLSSFELSSLALTPLLLIGFLLTLRRRSELVSVDRIARGEFVDPDPSTEPTRSIGHDQLLWSTNRTRNVRNTSYTLVETERGDQVWVPTRNIIATGY